MQKAFLELDGEKYIEYQVYDPLMVSSMWGYPIKSKKEIVNTWNAGQNIKILCKKKKITTDDYTFVGGTRQGSYFFALKENGIQTKGTEENQLMVEYLNTSFKEDVIQADLTNTPFGDSTFSVGLFHSSLFMNENTKVNRVELKEIKRIMKPESKIFIEGANGTYWEPVRKTEHQLYEYSSVEEGLWALKKDPSLAKWRRKENFLWLEFFFITINSEGLRVNHVYHFVPKQKNIEEARYYHEIVNYEPFEYRVNLLNEEGFMNVEKKPLTLADFYEDYAFEKSFNKITSPGGIVQVSFLP